MVPVGTSVPGFVHTPGNHCGSTALRNLLAFHGVEISEELAFGLGAGQVTFIVVTALASTLTLGAVADFNYAFTILQIPIGVIGVPLGIVLLPSLSRDAAVGRSAGPDRAPDGLEI